MKYAAILSAALALGMYQPIAVAQSAGVDVAKPALQSYIIRFAEPGLLYNSGQQRGYAATAPSVLGQRKLNASTPEALSYRQLLKSQQDEYVAAINAKVARSVAVSHYYDVTMSGIAANLHPSEVAAVRALEGVASVELAGEYQINTDAGPAWIGAPSIWNGSQTPTGVGTRGQGVLVGVMDSGGNSDHPSFANDPSCGFSSGNPKLVATKDCNTPNCATGNGEDVSFSDAAAAGSGGHGVHTASTAVGSAVAAGTVVGGVTARFNISGVAPCAKVITYKICGDTLPTSFASCPGAAIQAAIQASIVDQVDVVNFSVSGGTNPWSDNDRGFLDMLNADILVSASAGNTRAAPNNIPEGAVNHRGPWVLTVASSTHDRGEIPGVVSVSGGPQNVSGVGSTGPGWPTTAIVQQVALGSVLGSELGCGATSPYPAGSMTGKIALISRGTCSFAEKVTNATSAGAIAVLIYNNAAGAAISMGGLNLSTVPSMMVTQPDGIAIRDFLTANPAVTTSALGPQRLISAALADILSDFSLRGPNIIGVTTVGTNTYNGTDTTKPDITGPGSNIYAALSDTFGQFGFLSGTSMSSPHLAGSAALIRAANPTWTPMEVMSAIMLTAKAAGLRPDGTTPWDQDDVGSGRIDLTRAAKAGLVLNETFANFVAANPAVSGGQDGVRALNRASYRNSLCPGGVCVFTRTFRNTRAVPNVWNVVTTGAPAGTTITAVPSTLNFSGSLTETATVTFTVRITQAGGIVPGPVPRPNFGVIALVPQEALNPDQIFGFGFEDPRVTVPLRFTVAIAGPQAP